MAEDSEGFAMSSSEGAMSFANLFAAVGAAPKDSDVRVVTSEADYEDPLQSHVEENAACKASSVVMKYLNDAPSVANKGWAPSTEGGFCLTGYVEKETASGLYKALVNNYNHETCLLTASTGTTTFPGFKHYTDALGAADDKQKAVTAVIQGNYLLKSGEAEFPELWKVYSEVKDVLGPKFVLGVGHVLYCNSRSVAFKFHQDHEEHKKEVDLSVIIDLAPSKSTMRFAGEDESVEYPLLGSLVAFDAKLWHRSGRNFEDTIKVAFFFTFKPEDEPTEEKPDNDIAIDEAKSTPAPSAGAAEVAPEPCVKKEEDAGGDGGGPAKKQRPARNKK